MWRASDEALVAGMASGEHAAATAFVRRFQARVFGLARAIVRDPQAADEVAQEAFVRAWRYGASYDPRRGTVTAWLLGITRHAAIDHLARQARAPQLLADDVLDVLASVGANADDADRRTDLTVLVDELHALPPEQRDAFVASAYLGMTASEMSEAWDVPLGTIKSRLRLALRKLRASMARAEP
ncbi:MAG TPA: sigma-70 family RNA polymerase sigma factor [Acidimicrobiales bacterium]